MKETDKITKEQASSLSKIEQVRQGKVEMVTELTPLDSTEPAEVSCAEVCRSMEVVNPHAAGMVTELVEV